MGLVNSGLGKFSAVWGWENVGLKKRIRVDSQSQPLCNRFHDLSGWALNLLENGKLLAMLSCWPSSLLMLLCKDLKLNSGSGSYDLLSENEFKGTYQVD